MGRRILAIDDSLTIRKLLEMALGRAGYALELASTGQEGIQRAIRNPPELILLDYVLPDMKGLDVAGALARDGRAAKVPIVIMSAKSDDLRPLFREFPAVVEFVGKPFTPSEITFLVADLLARLATAPGHEAPSVPAAEAPGPVFTFAQKEVAAKAMFAHLRERFARIPEWVRAMGDATPAPFFARKILTPELLEALLAALVPTVREVAGAASPDAVRAAVSPALLQGQTSVIPLPHLLRELEATGRTGELRLEHESRATSLYLRRGQTVLVTHDRPDEYLRQATEDLSGIPQAILDSAQAEQRAAGKPVFVSLAEAGRYPAAELGRVLYQLGKKALLLAIEAGPGGFEWRELKELPGYIETFGRPLSLDQIQLERLRAVDDWSQVELHVNSLDLVFRRAEGFSARLAEFELNESERRVLTLVDDRNSVRLVIERSGLTTFDVFHCLFRLGQVGMIARREGAAAANAQTRPVAIFEPDREGVCEPLARLLGRRRRPVALLEIGGAEELIALCRRERPRLLVLNASAPGFDAVAAALEVRGTLEISDTALLAVVDREPGPRAEDLAAAGFDAVLVKPFLFTEIERLLAA